MGKSYTLALFGQWILGRNPAERIITVSYNEILASRFARAVRDGIIARSSTCRVVRDGIVQYEGRIASLRRDKDDAREVRSGFECGIKIENYDDVKPGDLIEAFAIEKIRRTLDDVDATGGGRAT